MTGNGGVLTASGYAVLLSEPNPSLQVAALEELNLGVDQFWPEIVNHMETLEMMADDETFTGRELASLVASKVYFHLQEYSDAITFALGAGGRFRSELNSDYTDMVVARVVDEYITNSDCEPRIVSFVEGLLKGCLDTCELECGLGMALETRRLDWVERYVCAAPVDRILTSLLSMCQDHIPRLGLDRPNQKLLLEILVDGYRRLPIMECDWSAAVHCMYLLDRYYDAGDVIVKLFTHQCEDSVWGLLMALQVALDVASHGDAHFSQNVLSHLEEKNIDDESFMTKIASILTQSLQSFLLVDFLQSNNMTDLGLINHLRKSVDTSRSSVLHNGVIMANALMQCGTSNDSFLRDNMDWLAQSTSWAKFIATASSGVCNKGHTKDARTTLAPYLPTPGRVSRSPYTEGGAFFAMGLIHSNHHDSDTEEYLRTSLSSNEGEEVLEVGACLGLGAVSLGRHSVPLYEQLRDLMFKDSAVTGEAAAFAIGMVMAGSNNTQAIESLLGYAHETQHEKIVRACAIAIAVIVCKREDEADGTINQMVNDSNSFIRYGGMFAMGMAYCGTSTNSIVKKLLQFSISDVNDDVKRAAVMSIGLVMSDNPRELPTVLKLLSQSFNPHVRYGVAIALGIGCAGQAMVIPDAVALLQALLSDVSEFVRQGALIGMGFVCQESRGKEADDFAALITKMPGDKHEDVMCRFGALLASGLMNLGGRNTVSQMFTRGKTLNLHAAVGFCLFAQMWYWYPLILMASLTASPTTLVALNKDLKMPERFGVRLLAKYADHDYPSSFVPEAKFDKSKLTSAVLSAAKKYGVTDVEMAAAKSTEEEETKPEHEFRALFNPCRITPAQEKLLQVIPIGDVYPGPDSKEEVRYMPIVPSRTSGFVVLKDYTPEVPETVIEMGPKDSRSDSSDTVVLDETAAEEVAPPEAFEWEG
jgi:26S proteasome regulatory subunit N2